MPGPLFIETDRLELRTVEEEDVDFLQAVVNHPEIRRFIQSYRFPQNREAYRDTFETQDSDPDAATLLAVPKAGEHAGDPVGSVQLAPVHDDRGWANFGVWLHPTAWGEGYATEASAHLLDYGFAELRLHRISAATHAANEGAIALCERLGFVHEGTKRDDVFHDGDYRDREMYALLEDEWAGADAVLR